MGGEPRTLEQENERLSELAQTDWLTGVYNRGGTEEKINALLARRQTGVLFVLDIESFKRVNDRYGHIVGDTLLQKLAQVLGYMVARTDIVGRVGGDEFVVYMPLQTGDSFVRARVQEIQRRLRAIQLEKVGMMRVAVTIGTAVYQEGDDYRSLFDRADQNLLEEKRARREGRPAAGTAGPEKKGLAVDMKLISSELAEQELIPGAFCQDYETFKSIYRFMGRRLRRTQGSAYLVLFTLTDTSGDFPRLSGRESQMDALRELVQASLRMGDVFTQYSSCQFLVMLADVGKQEAELVAGRIREAFFERLQGRGENVLLHHCYPLRPAGR